MIMTTAAWYSRLSWENSGQKLKKGREEQAMRKWKAVLIVFGCLLVSSLLTVAAFFAINKRLLPRDCFDSLKNLTKKDLRTFFQPLFFCDRPTYPENILPVYYVDTIHIDSPKVVEKDGKMYVTKPMPMDSIRSADMDSDSLFFRMLDEESRYLTVVFENRRALRRMRKYGWYRGLDGFITPKPVYKDNYAALYDDNYATLKKEYSIDSINVYRFRYEPEAFLVMLCADTVYYNFVDYDLYYNTYSKLYSIRLMPIYSWRNRLRVNKTYYHVIESLT